MFLQWLNHGSDITNDRNANEEVLISPRTVLKLRLRWKFLAGRDITATPAIANGVAYFPSWNGNIYAVNTLTGGLIWQRNLNELTGLNGTGVTVNFTVSRTTPAIAGDLLILGTYGPALIFAVSRFDGRLVWSTLLDPRPRAVITTSGTAYLGSVHHYIIHTHIYVYMLLNVLTYSKIDIAVINYRDGSIIKIRKLDDSFKCEYMFMVLQ